MKLGVDLVQMSMRHEMNQAILIAGDNDFMYAVKKTQIVIKVR